MAELLLTGDIDRSSEDRLMAGYTEAVGSDGTELVLDFGGVGYVNSTGIAVIVGLLGRARADGVRVSARGLSDHYREIFEVTRLADFMEIIDEGGRDA